MEFFYGKGLEVFRGTTMELCAVLGHGISWNFFKNFKFRGLLCGIGTWNSMKIS